MIICDHCNNWLNCGVCAPCHEEGVRSAGLKRAEKWAKRTKRINGRLIIALEALREFPKALADVEAKWGDYYCGRYKSSLEDEKITAPVNEEERKLAVKMLLQFIRDRAPQVYEEAVGRMSEILFREREAEPKPAPT